MQSNQRFDHKLLKATKSIERSKESIIEMNRMLTIITSLITVVKPDIERKLQDVISKHTKGSLHEKKPEIVWFFTKGGVPPPPL